MTLSSSLSFHPATVSDFDAIWADFVPAMKPYVEQIWGWDLSWQQNNFKKDLEKTLTAFIQLGSKTLGYVQYSLKPDGSYIHMLIIRPEFRAKGYGIQVLDYVQAQVPGQSLSLRCFQLNLSAQRFYHRQGFKVVESDDIFLLFRRGTSN